MKQSLRFPYGSDKRYHMHHTHILCADVEASTAFYRRWFDAEVAWDGDYAGTRNVFLKIGIGALHLYQKSVDTTARNAIHHLGIQVVGLDDLYSRMQQAGIELRNPIRRVDGGGYFMLQAPDNILLELFEPGPLRRPEVLAYYGYDES